MMVVHCGFGRVRTLALIVAALVMLSMSASAYAAGTEEEVPATSIVPSGGESAPAASGSPASASTLAPAGVVTPTPPTAKSKPATHHRLAASSREAAVEPAEGRLKLIEDSWVYSAPSKNSKKIEHVIKDKYVIVTGSTRNYLQVRLKNGETGYLDPAAVELLAPTDKVFVLTRDAAVLDKPNRWGKKLAEVHKTHNVHVVGLALNYMRIRMKNGLEGFIPVNALE